MYAVMLLIFAPLTQPSSTYKTSPLSQTAFPFYSLSFNLIWPQLLAWLLLCSPHPPGSPQYRFRPSQKSDCVSLHKLIFILWFPLCGFKAKIQWCCLG